MRTIVLFALILFTRNIISAQVSGPSVETAFQNYLQAQSGNVYTGSGLPSFMIKEDTKGNKYLFEKWVGGSVLGTNGVVYDSPKLLFNYNKMTQKLFMLLDSNRVMELSSKEIAGFTLKDGSGEYHFERLKNSTDLNFYQPAYKEEKGYSLYKLLTTKFKKADYQTNGIIESGNKFDEFVDEETYFILTPKQELVKIDFRKKSIEKVLESESEKVKSYFSQHKDQDLNEEFVKGLLQSLNSK